MKGILIGIMVAAGAMTAAAQSNTDDGPVIGLHLHDAEPPVDTIAITRPQDLDVSRYQTAPLPTTMFMPAIYKPYDHELYHVTDMFSDSTIHSEAWPWLHNDLKARRHAEAMRQYFSIHHPEQVPYNLMELPEPPKQYVVTPDPDRARFIIAEIPKVIGNAPELVPVDFEKRHWLNKFGMNLQFSQAYVSSNWYQGGNSSLNLIADFTYQSKLNTKFHPNLLFENYFQWKTALASTPDDPYRKYSLTENRFQINSKFGYKAIYNWYYSFNAMFKTPIFCGYKQGTQTRTASLLSPGELNIGLGMTYNYTSKQKKFILGLTISPLSYNLKTVIDKKVDEVSHGLEAGHKTKSSYGSSAELTWTWQICYNVKYTSRIFGFTDYKKVQVDWQNQFQFTINRFLTANLNVDMRYDDSTTFNDKWRHFQLRELVSLGFTYTVGN